MIMHTEQLDTSPILDMWYGQRSTWYDPECPYSMNVELSNPAYVDHNERTAREMGHTECIESSWFEGDHYHVSLAEREMYGLPPVGDDGIG